ncbi:MAG: hypothetical protein RBR74_11355 [Ignavibacteriaceae bacterium]|nr:hypothetical protein [Ignavibacteriaceae bacterium]
MKAKKSNQKTTKYPEVKRRFPLSDGKSYLEKMEDGYYKAFRENGTEITGVNLPINICLMALKGKIPSFVTVYPSDQDIEMEPSLKVLRDRFNQK